MSDDFFGAEIVAVDDVPNVFELIEPGVYTAIVLEVTKEDKQHRDGGDIREITFKFQIMDEGKFKNRYLWQRYSTVHPSDKAANFGRKMIGNLARAVGVAKVSSPQDLVNKAVGIKVKIDPEREWNGNTYAARNQVAGFMSTEEEAPASEEPAKKEATPDKATPPWAK